MEETSTQDSLTIQKELLIVQSRDLSKQLIEETEAYEFAKAEKKDAERGVTLTEQDLEREKKLAIQREQEAKRLKIQQKRLKTKKKKRENSFNKQNVKQRKRQLNVP